MVRRSRGPSVATLLAALLLTGCTATTGGQPAPAGSPAGPSAGAEPSRTAKPKDRDLQAVTVALRRLDACGLIDVNAAGGNGTTLLPTGPHSCMLAPTANYSPGTSDRGVEVLVGADNSDQFIQYRSAPLTIGGAKAYEYREYSSRKRCELYFPVSFTRVITFRYEKSGDTDTCRVLRQLAESAVTRLGNPDTITVDPAKRPFASWDGCSFLSQLLGPEARNYTYRPAGTYDPFSGCYTSRNKQLNPNSPPGKETGPKLEVAYDRAPEVREPRQIGGKVADVARYGDRCQLAWNQGDSGAGNPWFAALMLTLSAADCDTAARLAEQAVRLAGQPPGDASARPHRPLLYRPDENDTGAVGACVDFGVPGGQADCEPYHPVPVPQGTERILGAANRNLQCAVFTDSVKALFGPSFNALTWAEHCYFVEPTHALKIQVNLIPDFQPAAYGDDPKRWVDRQKTQLAGKPAITFWDENRSQFDIYLSPFNDLTRPGAVHIQVEALPGRGDGSPRQVKLDPAEAETAKQVITQVTRKYFAG